MSRFMSTRARRVPAGRAAGVALAVIATGAGIAQAADDRYVRHSVVEPANPGLTVSGSLGKSFRAVNSARVIVPVQWRVQKAKAGQRKYLSVQNSACHFRITFTAKSRLGAPGEALAYVNAGLPAAGSRYVLDSGVRNGGAFRVVRKQTTGAVRVDGLFATVLTRRDDVAPAGQVAWAEVRVVATSSPGDECHSGTYRQALGPQIGDALATARARLTFAKPAR
jgi:hypothetical protein